jgi:predicted MPP superfamily phosphohydrolase
MNGLKADIIVMTGDLVDGSVAHLKDDVAPLVNLKAKYKYFITGNHEYYSGAEDWIEEVKRLGFTVLLNEHELIEVNGAKLLLAGVTDYRAHQYIPAHQSSPKKAMQGAPKADVKILLAHQPKSIDEATRAGFDLQISGHTHGGQYYPWNFIAKMVNPYIKGLHLHEHKTWIYISPGTGYWGPPIRLGNEPEITVFKLT